jgi:hypothetical protein
MTNVTVKIRHVASVFALCAAFGLAGCDAVAPKDANAPRPGSITETDQTLTSGEWHDVIPMKMTLGQKVRIEMTSAQFNPYLIVIDPNGEQTENDTTSAPAPTPAPAAPADGSAPAAAPSAPAPGSKTVAINFTAPVAGDYQIVPTTVSAGEKGDYTIVIGTF